MLEEQSDKTNSIHPWKLGKNYIIRTATMIDMGKLVAIYDSELVLDCASWIADTGIRYGQFVTKGIKKSNKPEIEFCGDGYIVSRTGIIDAAPFNHELPLSSQ